jgi:dTDP-glucose 4,6-dehydratase
MQTVLITGGAGFIGANFIPYFLENSKGMYSYVFIY